jgi:hypothetical protein
MTASQRTRLAPTQTIGAPPAVSRPLARISDSIERSRELCLRNRAAVSLERRRERPSRSNRFSRTPYTVVSNEPLLLQKNL